MDTGVMEGVLISSPGNSRRSRSILMHMADKSADQSVAVAPDQTHLKDLSNIHHELTYATLINQTFVPPHDASVYDSSPSRTTPSVRSEDTRRGDSLPDFIKPVSSHLTLDDIDYLHRKGAFEIPSVQFLEAVLRSYVEHFHPFMPLLDPISLLQCTKRPISGPLPKISILLLQAVIFVGVTFVDEGVLQKAGYSTRRLARKMFYERARVSLEIKGVTTADKDEILYDLDADCDRITVIQATLLMSYWSETPGDNKGGWHWMGVALSLALTLGLHRQQRYEIPSPQSRLLKRIWWSCYIRDRILALGMSRALRIRSTDYDTKMLILDDFELDDFSAKPADDGPFSLDCQTVFAQLCIKMAELCVHIGAVVELHYSLLPTDNVNEYSKDPTGRHTTILFPKFQAGQSEGVKRMDQELQMWLNSRPPTVVFPPSSTENTTTSASATLSHQAFLHICFYATVSALHRPQVDPRNEFLKSLSPEERGFSVMRIEEASMEMASTNRQLHHRNLSAFLPPAAATFQLPIIITHLKLLQQAVYQCLEVSLESIFYSLKVLEKMRETYIGVDMVIPFAMDIIKRASVTPVFGQDNKLAALIYKNRHFKFSSDTRLQERPATEEMMDTASAWLVPSNQEPGSKFEEFPGLSLSGGSQSQVVPNEFLPPLGCPDDIFLTDGMDLEGMFPQVDFWGLDLMNEDGFNSVGTTEQLNASLPLMSSL